MTLEEILALPLKNKHVLILGRPGAGKTWLSKVLEPMNPHHGIIHTDTYLTTTFGEERQIEAIIEDAVYYYQSIVEGMLGYRLLLEGAKRKCYLPEVVIEVVISRGQQRKIYLAERSPEKIKALEWAHMRNTSILNEYLRIVPAEQKPTWLTLNNSW